MTNTAQGLWVADVTATGERKIVIRKNEFGTAYASVPIEDLYGKNQRRVRVYQIDVRLIAKALGMKVR